VFHWIPIVGSAVGYGTDPLGFFFKCREKVSRVTKMFCIVLMRVLFQYGDVFTFILFGRRVTVALGPKGNNFILGGKSIVFNAEDAYTVSTVLSSREELTN
jgi:sterol 14-demethylase